MEKKLLKPFVKWAGGKSQLLEEIRKYIPEKFDTYFEPFLGGGAVLFDLAPKKFIVNDINLQMINVYAVVKSNIEGLIKELKSYKNDSAFFYALRELDRTSKFAQMSPVKKAARILYLNKTCFNGLFRVNSSGQFNVPFGNYKNPDFINEITLYAVHNYLNSSKGIFLNVDFEEAVKNADKDSFVYFDPPYDPISNSSSFTGYTMNGFGKEQQERLKLVCDNLNKKSCRFLVSNSSTKFIKDLYKDYKITTVKATRNINSKATGRGSIDEVLISNY